MTKIKQVFIAAVAVLMVLGIRFLVPGTVRADEYLPFPNVKQEAEEITWDRIPDIDTVYIGLCAPGKDTPFATSGYSGTKTSCRPFTEIKECVRTEEGDYKIILSATDHNNKKYRSEFFYHYSIHTLNKVTNIRIQGDFLTWDFNDPKVTDEDIFYELMIITIDSFGNDIYQQIKLNENRIPLTEFLYEDTRSYYISVCVKSYGPYQLSKENFKMIDYSGKKYTNDESDPYTTNGFITWNKYPDAAGYIVGYKYAIADHSYGTNHINIEKNSFPVFRELNKANALKGQDIEFYVQPVDSDNACLTARKTIKYHYSGEPINYPMFIDGKQLTSDDDLNNILGNTYSGNVSYDPLTNTLDFHDAVIFRLFPKDVPMFYSTRSLKINGKAEITSGDTIFASDMSLEFNGGSEIKGTSDVSAIVCSDIIFNACNIDMLSHTGNTLDANTGVCFMTDCISVAAETEDPSACAIKTPRINAGLMTVQYPENGYIDRDNAVICDKDGNIAKAFRAVNIHNIPTPTPQLTITSEQSIRIRPTSSFTTATPTPVTASPVATATAVPTVTGEPTSSPVATATVAVSATTTAATAATPTIAESQPTAAVSESTPAPIEGANDISAFVKRIYIYVLDREPEAEGAAFWTSELNDFRRTGAEVAQGFIFSPEFEARGTSDEEFVTILYRTFFDREPEADGLNFWLSQLSSGAMDRVSVAGGFIFSQEWADTCASYGIRSGGNIVPQCDIEPTALTYSFVERMYTKVMQRDFDEQGRQYWASELSNFKVTGETCGAAFFLSDEFISYNLTDEDFVSRLYATFMDREADSDGASFWISALASGTPRSDVVFGFTRSREFTDKCIEARILPY